MSPAHPEELAGQVTPAAQPNQPLTAIDRQFPHNFLRRIAAPEPKGTDIGKKLIQLRIAGGPGDQSSDDNRLREQDDQILDVCPEDSELPLQKNRKRKRPSFSWPEAQAAGALLFRLAWKRRLEGGQTLWIDRLQRIVQERESRRRRILNALRRVRLETRLVRPK